MNTASTSARTKNSINRVEVATLVIAILGILALLYQLHQSNKHKKWDNYNALNAAYHSLYQDVYDGSYSDLLKKYSHISNLDAKQLAWVRAYFDLYAEEFWLDQQCLIPKNMFQLHIDGGVNLNLKQHPVMIDGYKYWRDKGAFQHPKGFTSFVDEKIICLEKQNETTCSAVSSEKYSNKKWYNCIL